MCASACAELVNHCHHEAFPDQASCLSGCRYNAELGADLQGLDTCIEAATCDLFATVECEHATLY